jgi:hypothetical protein
MIHVLKMKMLAQFDQQDGGAGLPGRALGWVYPIWQQTLFF